MQEFLDMILDVRARVLASIDEGMTLEAVMAINQLERHPDVVCQRCGATTNFFAVDRRCGREAG